MWQPQTFEKPQTFENLTTDKLSCCLAEDGKSLPEALVMRCLTAEGGDGRAACLLSTG